MANEVTLSLRADLAKAMESIQRFQDQMNETGDTFQDMGKKVGESFDNQAKKSESFIGKLRDAGRRTANQLKGDFKILSGVTLAAGGFSLFKQGANTIREAISLSDAVRKLATSFGVAKERRAGFQSELMKTFGKQGLSSESASEALQGLAGKGIHGEKNVMGAATQAAQLASLGKEPGKTADIASGIAELLREMGKSTSDLKEWEAVSKAVSQAMDTTGKSASEIIALMQESSKTASIEKQQKMTPKGMAQVAAASSVVGPGVANLVNTLQSLIDPGKIARAQAMGLDKLVTKEGGINLKALPNIKKEMQRLSTSPGQAAEIIGGSEEAGRALQDLLRRSDELNTTFETLDSASGDFASKQQENMGLMESFNANLNQTKGLFSRFISDLTQGMTNFLTMTSHSISGAAAVTAGSAVASSAAMSKGAQMVLQKVAPGVTGAAGSGGIVGPAAAAIVGNQVGQDIQTLGQPGGVGAKLREEGFESFADSVDKFEKVISDFSASIVGMRSRPSPLRDSQPAPRGSSIGTH